MLEVVSVTWSQAKAMGTIGNGPAYMVLQLLPPKSSFLPGIQQGGDAPRFLLKSATVAPSGKQGKVQAETCKSSCGRAKS